MKRRMDQNRTAEAPRRSDRTAGALLASATLLTLTAVLAVVATAWALAGRRPVRDAAYAFALTHAPRRVMHWPASSPVRVFLAGGGGAAARRLERAFLAAAADWERALGGGLLRTMAAVVDSVAVAHTSAGLGPLDRRTIHSGPAAAAGPIRFRATPHVTDAHVVIAWAGGRLPIETAICEPIEVRSAVTTFCANEEWTGLRPFPLRSPNADEPSRVRMLVTLQHDAAPTLLRTRQLLAHELGHVLGIGHHSSHPQDLMWGGLLQAVRPTAADVATARALYRARADLTP